MRFWLSRKNKGDDAVNDTDLELEFSNKLDDLENDNKAEGIIGDEKNTAEIRRLENAPHSQQQINGFLQISQEQRLFHYIFREFEAVAKNPIEGIYVTPGEESLLVWFGLLIVRTGIFYGGIFRFILTLPDNFPDSESLPVVQFEEPLFHPLVNSKTNCVDLSRYFPSGWQRDRNHIYQVIIATQSIFFSCHCDSTQAANPEAAILLKENRKKFVQMAHDTVRRSRTQVYAQPNSDDLNAIRFTPWDKAKMEPFRQYLLGRTELPMFKEPAEENDEEEEIAPAPKAAIVRTKKELLDTEDNEEDMDVSLPPPEWFDDDDDWCASPQNQKNALVSHEKALPFVHRKRRRENTANALVEGKPKTKRKKKLMTKKKRVVETPQKAVEGEEGTAAGEVSDGEDLETALPVERKSVAKRGDAAERTQNGDEGGWASDNDLVVLFETAPTAVVSAHKLIVNGRQNCIKRELFNGTDATWPPKRNTLGRDIGMPSPMTSKYGVVSNAERRIMKAISGCRNQFPKEFNEFNKLIWTHLTTNLQNDHTFTWKMRVRLMLHNQIRLMFPNSHLLVVGSTVNGCGAYNSDIDLCLGIACPIEHFNTSKGYAGKHLRKVRRVLNALDIVRHVEYIPAKVPILKMNFAHPYSTLEADINVNNFAGVYNSFLLHNYSRIDDRFPAICLLVKHWAKVKGISDASGGYLNSYSLILMVLHFLQCGVDPPVLPNLQQLYPDLFSLRRPFTDLVYFEDLPTPLPEIQQNDRTVGELLIAFFDYFNRFDFNRYAISVRRGCVFPRTELPPNTERFRLFIEEPFDHQNTARCVTNDDQWMIILDTIGKAAKALSPNSKQAPDLLKLGIRIKPD
ncbi:hypothetical protein niasHS_014931 [Heterodera schachtii]|uniref:UBC core domain-containing protein n=1 Tax=Heterodera schachtii TaxID=97005 RepID=A0ABD2ING2_HETSC